MHVTFLPIGLFGVLGLGYYLGLFVGTFLVLISVIICFEIARRATYARILFGIKGGYEEVSQLFPFNKITNRSTQTLIGIFAHLLVLVMVILLSIMLFIGTGLMSE